MDSQPSSVSTNFRTVDGIDEKGQIRSFRVSDVTILNTKRLKGYAGVWEIAVLVPEAMARPVSVFYGLRGPGTGGYAYVLDAQMAWVDDRMVSPSPYPDQLFVVGVEDSGEIYACDWIDRDATDSKVPTGHNVRYQRRIF